MGVKRPLPGAAAIALVLLVTACVAREAGLAKVGGDTVDVEAFQVFLEAVTAQDWESVDARVAIPLLDQFIDQEVVAAAAGGRTFSMPVDPGQRSAVVRRLLDDACGPPPEARPSVVAEETSRRMAAVQAVRARVRQILVDSEESAAEVRRRLEAGEEFLDLSRELSRAPNAADGGTIGLIAPGTLSAELDEVVFSLGPGEVSAPIEGPGGFHVFQVLEVIPEGPPDRHEAERVVIEALRERIARDHMRACVDRLAQEVGARVQVDHLWFDYDGRYAEANHALQE